MSAPARRAKVERTGRICRFGGSASCSTWRARGSIGPGPRLPPTIWL